MSALEPDSPEPKIPVVGPWAQEKIDRLAKYLNAYTVVLKDKRWTLTYVDAFAGGGEATIRSGEETDEASLFDRGVPDVDTREVIRGSPARALDIRYPFNHYIFIEKNPERRAMLEGLKEHYGRGRSIRVIGQDCNEYLRRLTARVRKSEHRGVVFLDPFGMQVPWSTVTRIADTGALEVFINFPVGMAIQRLLRRDGDFTPKQRARLDSYFGDPSWHAAVYSARLDLFGQETTDKHEGSGERLVTWYCQRLRGAFGHVSDPYLVKNSGGGHLYYLIFAGPNETGAKIANDVLHGGERVGPRSTRGKRRPPST